MIGDVPEVVKVVAEEFVLRVVLTAVLVVAMEHARVDVPAHVKDTVPVQREDIINDDY